MTKTPSSQHFENRDAWTHRQLGALKTLEELEEGHLEKLLGPDYSLFLDLERAVKPPKPAVKVVKRKASDTEVVDLEGDRKKNFKITSFFTKKPV